MFAKKKLINVQLDEISCSSCFANVEKSLLEIKGVKKVETSIEDKKVTVLAKISVSEDLIRETVKSCLSHE